MTDRFVIVKRAGTRRPNKFARIEPAMHPAMQGCRIRLVPGLTPWDPRTLYSASVPLGFGSYTMDKKDSAGLATVASAAGTGVQSVIDGRHCFDFWKHRALGSERRGFVRYYADSLGNKQECTMSAWVKIPTYADGGGNVRRIIWSRYTNWQFKHEGGTRLQYEYYNPTSTTVDAPSNTINDNRWHHVACSLSHANQRGRLYEDGELVKEDFYTYNFSQNQSLNMGVRDSALRYQITLDTYYDDMCYWDRELSPAEIYSVYSEPWAAFPEYVPVLPVYVPPPMSPGLEFQAGAMLEYAGGDALDYGSGDALDLTSRGQRQ